MNYKILPYLTGQKEEVFSNLTSLNNSLKDNIVMFYENKLYKVRYFLKLYLQFGSISAILRNILIKLFS